VSAKRRPTGWTLGTLSLVTACHSPACGWPGGRPGSPWRAIFNLEHWDDWEVADGTFGGGKPMGGHPGGHVDRNQPQFPGIIGGLRQLR